EPSGDDADEEDEEQDEDDDDEEEEHQLRPTLFHLHLHSIDAAEEEALTTLEGVNTGVTELAAVQEQDTQDIYGVMEDT
nr:hypothetical protein [Tanacetum cinerariifolium]